VNNWRAWLKGFTVAVISAAASVVSGMALAPDQWKLILKLAAIDGVKAGAAYLKQSPLPGAGEGK
jgi:hypothetical protein